MSQFPAGLLDWAGHRAGGVRRLFHSGSGRPSRTVVETPLLRRLKAWASALATKPAETPRVVLLVGGPGNGKTEAVESAILSLDEALGLAGSLTTRLSQVFTKDDLTPVPRLAVAPLATSPAEGQPSLVVVQDASVNDPTRPGVQPPDLLIEDLETYALGPSGAAYLACVNRGILDDALIAAVDAGKSAVATLITETIRAVGISPDATSCWPLERFPHIAVWPMDVETLVATTNPDERSAAAQLLGVALNKEEWPEFGTCAATERCPHCNSMRLLSHDDVRKSLLTILRWYELATGKRWTFRDLNSLFSYLLAGANADETGVGNPCEWAAAQLAAVENAREHGRPARQIAPYLLVAAQYQHALFGTWSSRQVKSLQKDLRAFEKKDGFALKSQDTVAGLLKFLAGNRGVSVPATLQAQLPGLSEYLDPALADPETELPHGGKERKTLRDVDVRFSQSVSAGLAYVRPHRWLTPVETDLLERLRAADDELSDSDVRRAFPGSASRLQAAIRDFSCRLVRRSLGVRFAFTRDAALLDEFQRVAEGQKELLHEASKQVELLLNEKEKFEICLNTTFGEPLPPRAHRAVLRTTKQKVKAREVSATGRPASSMRFLSIGTTKNPPLIPLTYELFRSVRELRNGLLRASLPRTVVALLDTTRARLAGVVVRDSEVLDDAEIFLGERPEVIGRELDAFVVRQRGES